MTHNNDHKNGHETSLQEDGMKGGAERDNLWSIVLAGGDGVRTKEFIRRWLGYEKPK